MLRTSIDFMKENSFTLTKAKSRRYPAQTITDMDYAGDIALLAITPAQAQSQLHSQERAAGGIRLHMNADKTEFMCFNQRGDLSTRNGMSLKLVDKFIYLRSSVSSTEIGINTRLAKVLTANDRLSVILKVKGSSFQALVVSILIYGCTKWTLTARTEKKLEGNCT